MPEHSESNHKTKRVGLLGASFDTGNMGVSALAESTIKCILHRWPDAEVTLLDSGRTAGEYQLRTGDKDLCIRELPIRFCKNIFLDNHFFVLCLYALLFKVFRWEGFKRFCARRNASLDCITQMDLVADITGGDSFSDIYGMSRFTLGFLRKWLVLLYGKKLIMLPQTYGPFKRNISKAMAKYILRRASVIYSRDRDSLGYVQKLLGNRSAEKNVRFAPDVAFVLDSRKPDNFDGSPLSQIPNGSTIVGLNVSGLLFNGGYTGDNMFGLKADYRSMIQDVIEMLLEDENRVVLLIPHVFPPAGCEVESDPDACVKIYERVRQKYPGRILLVKGKYDQGEIKYIIGLCDFFIGSRMHACIAALSQYVPAVGLAYSKKFQGVFETVRAGQYVIDLREKDEVEIIESIVDLLEQENALKANLDEAVGAVHKQIEGVFGDIYV